MHENYKGRVKLWGWGGGNVTQHLNLNRTAALACDGDSCWNAGLTNRIARGVFFVLVSVACFFRETWSTRVDDNAPLSCGGEETDSGFSRLTEMIAFGKVTDSPQNATSYENCLYMAQGKNFQTKMSSRTHHLI